MKRPFWFCIVLFSLLLSVTVNGQDLHPNVDNTVYQKAIEDELTIYGGSRYLYDNADGYQRMIQNYAQRRLSNGLSDTERDITNTDDSIYTESTMDISSLSINDQDETTIAISRLNPKIIVVGANDVGAGSSGGMVTSGMPVYSTVDAGKSWKTLRIPRPTSSYAAYGDPIIATGDSGFFYYSYLVAKQDGSKQMNLLVAFSHDGIKWTNGTLVIPDDSIRGAEDKESLWVDNSKSSPHLGRVYITWLHLGGDTFGDDAGARISWSDDRCKTWSTPKHLTDSVVRFSELRTGKNGEVFVSFSVSDYGNQTLQHRLLVSGDGGNSFLTRNLSNFIQYPRRYDHYPSLKGSFGIRAYPYITQDVDLKTNRIHLVYGSRSASLVDSPYAVLYYINSTDLGNTWTNPLALGLSNPQYNALGHDRFCPWISVDQKTGEAYCSYYSSERDPDNILIAAFRTKLSNDLRDFPSPLEDSDFDPTLLIKAQGIPFIGDYQGSDSYDSVYAAAWTEGKGSTDGDVFVYIETPNHPASGVKVVVHSSNIWLSNPSPNPSRGGMISFSYYLPHESIMEIAIYDISGVKLKTLMQAKSESGTYTKEFIIGDLPSGAYILRLSSSEGSIQKNVIVTK